MIRICIVLFMILVCGISFAQDTKEQEALFVAKRAFEDSFYDVSMTLFQRFLAKYPESPLCAEANFYIGQCYFYKKKYAEALSQFNKLLESDSIKPLRDKLYYWIAEVYFKTNDFYQASVFYDKLVSEYPQSPFEAHAFYSLGWCLLGQGKFELAKEKFIDFRNKFPYHALAQDAAFKAAECLYNLKNYSELKTYLENFNKEYPKSAKAAYAKFYLAESYFYTEDYNSAVSNYIKALEAVSDTNLTSLINLGLGWSYLKVNDFVNAKSNFDRVALSSTDKKNIESALFGTAVALQMTSEYNQAIDVYQKLIAQTASIDVLYEAYLGTAEAFYNLDNYKEASAAYKKAQGYINKDTPPAMADRLRYGLGLSYLKLGNFEGASWEFSFLIDGSKDDALKVAALTRLADAYLESKDTEKAIKAYESILKDYPNCKSCDYLLYAQGVGLFNSKLYDRAIAVFKETIAKYPQSQYLEEVNFYLASSYFEAGDFLNSYQQLDSFVNKYTSSEYKPKGLLLKGLSLKSLKKYQDAYDTFKIIVKDFNEDVHLVGRAEFELADCSYYLGRHQEAVDRFESLRSKYAEPDILSIVLWRLAEHYFKESNFDLCRRYLLDIINGFPQGVLIDDAYYMLGLCLEKQGLYRDALDAFSKVTGKNPVVYPKIADVYKALGDYFKAISYYRLALEESGADKPILQFKLAESLEESGKLDDAVREYSRIPADSPLLAKGLLRSCQIFENQENWPAAVDFYKKIIELNVEEAKFAKERIAVIEECEIVKNR